MRCRSPRVMAERATFGRKLSIMKNFKRQMRMLSSSPGSMPNGRQTVLRLRKRA